MNIGPADNPIAGRIDPTTLAAAQAQQAAQRRDERRQKVEPAEQAEKPRVSDRERRPSRGAGPAEATSSDVQQQVADYARKIPPPEDLLAVQASANTFALINLDAAKEIARSVRDSLESRDARGVSALQDALFSDKTDRSEVADALAG